MSFSNKTKEELLNYLLKIEKEFSFNKIIQNIEKEKQIRLEMEVKILQQTIFLQNREKEKRAAELIIANLALKFRDEEEVIRAHELVIANIELAFQNKEKGNRAAELLIANKELIFQNNEKVKRAIELEIANQNLQDFCNIISHNLRAPIVNISMIADCIEECQDEEEQKELLSKLKLVIHHLNETLNELVESLQVKQLIEIKSENIILKKCLEKNLLSFIAEIEFNKVKIETYFDDAFSIYYPRKYLDSILTNLISNALKYKSPNRKLVIKIKAEKINGNSVLSVSDNGLGIDLVKNDHKLFKLKQTFHKHPDAKGFGLFMIKSQVGVMGGKIWAESTPDIGSTFFVEFKNKTDEYS